MYIETIDGFDIHFEALPEDLQLQDTFDDTVTDIDQLARDIDSGKYEYFCAKVSANKSGVELGTDYLGACLYDSIEQFYTEYHDDYFIDMVSSAIDEAKATIELINH